MVSNLKEQKRKLKCIIQGVVDKNPTVKIHLVSDWNNSDRIYVILEVNDFNVHEEWTSDSHLDQDYLKNETEIDVQVLVGDWGKINMLKRYGYYRKWETFSMVIQNV